MRPALVWPDQRLCSTPPPLDLILSTLFGAAGAAGARGVLRQLQRQAAADWLALHEAAL